MPNHLWTYYLWMEWSFWSDLGQISIWTIKVTVGLTPPVPVHTTNFPRNEDSSQLIPRKRNNNGYRVFVFINLVVLNVTNILNNLPSRLVGFSRKCFQILGHLLWQMLCGTEIRHFSQVLSTLQTSRCIEWRDCPEPLGCRAITDEWSKGS